MTTTRRICDTHESDQVLLKKFMQSVDRLCDMVKEMMDTTPQLVLSPLHRELLTEQAAKVDKLRGKFYFNLCVDNPGEPLNEN
jgi:uncharacterized protein YpbB